MRYEEGPAFGAFIIGVGIAFLVYQRTASLPLALLVGAGLAIADYVLVTWIKNRFKK